MKQHMISNIEALEEWSERMCKFQPTRTEIEVATAEFLKSGGKITKIEPEIIPLNSAALGTIGGPIHREKLKNAELYY
jgi:hypothetical protein